MYLFELIRTPSWRVYISSSGVRISYILEIKVTKEHHIIFPLVLGAMSKQKTVLLILAQMCHVDGNGTRWILLWCTIKLTIVGRVESQKRSSPAQNSILKSRLQELVRNVHEMPFIQRKAGRGTCNVAWLHKPSAAPPLVEAMETNMLIAKFI